MKKFRLTNVLSLILLLLMGVSTLSCSNEVISEVDPTSLNTQTGSAARDGDDVETDTTFIVESTKAATINFTKEIKAFYSPGMSYSDLKSELDPTGHLSNITPVGDALLHEAYANIVENVREEDMNGLKMAEALHYILKLQLNAGVVKVEDVNFEKGSKELFGLNQSYETTARSQPCKWYQIGCHLSNFWNWLSSPASGGTGTNGSVLAQVVAIAGGAVALLTSLFGGGD